MAHSGDCAHGPVQVQPPAEGEYSAMHAKHRTKLMEALGARGVKGDALVLLQGGEQETRHETDHEHLFRQESSFQYLMGVREPDCWVSIKVPAGFTTLYIPRLPQEYATWMGAIKSAEYYRKVYAVDDVKYVDDMEADILQTEHTHGQPKGIDGQPNGMNGQPNGTTPSSGMGVVKTILLSHGYNHDGKKLSNTGIDAAPWLKNLPKGSHCQVDTTSLLYDAIVDCRVIKTEEELGIMRKVNDISSDAHLKVMNRAKVGMGEYQLESMFLHECYYSGGCRHQAYTSICGCGPNSAVLHYGHAGAPNDRIIGPNDMLLLDMGAEYHCYASDITCSFPSSGRFTDDQRMVFEAVSDMQLQVMKAMKPGVQWLDMHTLAYRVGLEHLVKGGLLHGSIDEMMEANLGAVFMPHGLGHLIGLDTHDVGGYPEGTSRDKRPGYSSLRCNRPLLTGMCITVEPGIYFIDYLLEEAMMTSAATARFIDSEQLKNRFSNGKFGGVRLEDCVIVTENGIRNMTNCPRSVRDVEDVMSGKITDRSQLEKRFYTADD